MRPIQTPLVLLVALATLACGSDGTTAVAPAALMGTYTLTLVNGAPLPFVRQASNPRIEIAGERIVVDANGTFVQTASYMVTPLDGAPAAQGAADSGTWTLDGLTATFRFASDHSAGVATVSGSQFTVVEGGNTYVFVRQSSSSAAIGQGDPPAAATGYDLPDESGPTPYAFVLEPWRHGR